MTRETEKQASREADAKALADGTKSAAQLWAENTFLPAAKTSIDLRKVSRLR